MAALRGVNDRVVAWTVNDVRRALRLRRLGVAGLTTDRTDVLTAMTNDLHAP